MNLTPDVGVKTFGRDAFRIHGMSKENSGSSSHGCVCLPHSARIYIAAALAGKVDVGMGLYDSFKDCKLEIQE
jgi:hypothetical protein